MENVKNRLKMNGLLYNKKSVDGSLWEKYSHIENRMSEKSGVEVEIANYFSRALPQYKSSFSTVDFFFQIGY